MHPDIRAFWEKQGYAIEMVEYKDGNQFPPNKAHTYYLRRHRDFTHSVAVVYVDSNIPSEYWFEEDLSCNGPYTEEMMLRIIALSAFR
jgi:hypothetical protein